MPIDIPDFDGVRRTVPTPAVGRLGAGASRSTAFSTEDLAVITALAADTAAAKAAVVSLAALIAGSELTVSDPVTRSALATLGTFVDGLETLVGATNSALGTLATHVDGLESAFASLLGRDFATEETLDNMSDRIGSTSTPTWPAADTDAANLSGRMIRLAQHLTALRAQHPASLGTKAAAASLAATLSTEDKDLLQGLLNAAEDATPVQVVGSTAIVAVTLSTDTAAYADGDVLAETQALNNAMRLADAAGVLQSLVVIDEADQGFGIDVFLLDGNVSLGTENAAPSISDANAAAILGMVSVSAADFIDLGGVRMATKVGIGLPVKPVSGTRNLYVAAIVRGAGTYTATSVKLRFGFLQD